MIKAILKEYGVPWSINRALYSSKLKMMKMIPKTEILFEKKVNIKRIDIFELNTKNIKLFLEQLDQEDKQSIIEEADRAIVGSIKGFSSIELDYGNPINWNYSPDFDKERGDIKVIWEISRFTHFYCITRAFLITEDIKYYEAFSSQIKSWIENNEYSYGSNYKCGQESALRMINILMAYTVFKKHGLTTESDDNNVKKIIEGGYKKILSNFFYAHKCIKNNHTFSEICGLIIGAWCCEDNHRLKKAYKLLDKEIETQFMNDGGYVQFSFNYQRFTLQILECVLKISEKTGMNISDKSKKIVSDSAYLMYQVQDESGDLPNYGSNDGALIFPVTVCGYRDFRPVINTIYCLINGKRLYSDGKYNEELLWFGKNSNLDCSMSNIKRESKSFKDAGIYTLRNDNNYMMITLPDYKTRPDQMDGLHIDLWKNKKNIFCDSGTYSYATELGKKLSLTESHNTVQIENREQMNKHGPFLIYNWTSTENIVANENSFKGTMVSKNRYKHTRSIEYHNKGYIINDNIEAKAEYCNFYFHTPFDVIVVGDEVRISDKQEHIATMIVSKGEISISKKYRSLYYLRKEEINCINIRCDISNDICDITFDIKFKN